MEIRQIAGSRLHRGRIRKLLRRGLRVAKAPANARLSIAIIGDQDMIRLNRAYRKKRGTTDVLAFASREAPLVEPDGAEDLGEIIVSYDQAKRQAREGGRTIESEIHILIAHGLLHLLGHDHDTAKNERRMYGLQDVITGSPASRRQ